MKIEIAQVYEPAFDMRSERCIKNLWYSPRASAKSSTLGRIIWLYYINFPDYDVAIGVDSLTNAGDGVLSEFRSFLESENLADNWVFSDKTCYMKGSRNQIRSYAVQTNKLDNVNATKSKKLVRPVSLFVMDEVQKLHGKNILDNCLSTFLRQMKAGHSKVILAGNPDRSAMWFDDYYKAKLTDDEWVVIKPTYLDIVAWLPQALLHEIEMMKKTDPVSYAQIYLGDLEVAGWEQTFHSFIEREHYIPREELLAAPQKTGDMLHSIVIGIDDAESKDAIAGSSLMVQKNGLMRVNESLYLSCKELPVKPALTERCAIVIKYLDYIQQHFNPERATPVIMVFDCASGMYRQMAVIMKTDVNYMRWRNVVLKPYTTKGEKEEQLDEVNTAFANGILRVVNVDKYSPQYSNKTLVKQIKSLRYLENKKIDPTIPNDCTDALQYAVMTVLANPYRLTFPERRAIYDSDNGAKTFMEKLQYGDI